MDLSSISPALCPQALMELSQIFAKENLFALSLFPYLGFLWLLRRSPQTPKLVMVGFYVLLVFVVVTIPAGLYAESHYQAQLADVDWLHGSAEVFLSLSNLLVVFGFIQGLARQSAEKQENN
ncbi:DUF3593 domain-containing protein [Synechocystis sp. B12]|nr:DUF3593 domain-containing protein [Synechocystis sp. B12]